MAIDEEACGVELRRDVDDHALLLHGLAEANVLELEGLAVDAARKLSDRGENAAVYLMGQNGRFRREWACEEAA
jgi:hypothetical protein